MTTRTVNGQTVEGPLADPGNGTSSLMGFTVADHYWAVCHGYGSSGRYTQRDAFVAAMEQSREIVERYDLNPERADAELQRSIAETAARVTIEERIYFKAPDGPDGSSRGGIETDVRRRVHSWLNDEERHRYRHLTEGT